MSLLYPTSEVVAVAWVKGVPGIPAGQVATRLPQDNTTWAASGALVVRAVGGTPHTDMPLRQTVISVDGWAVNPSSGKPPDGKALQLIERVRLACYGERSGITGMPSIGRDLTLPSGYMTARVISARALSEPRILTEPESSYAHAQLDVQFDWTPT